MNKNDDETNNILISQRYDSAVQSHLKNRNALFLRGVANYKDVDIPNFNKQMTSLQMKELYIEKGVVNNVLSPFQLGALYQQINIKSKEEHISYILNMTEKFSTLFTRNGCTAKRLIPQSFYLALVGDKYSGRCYPLVRAMSVALAANGSLGANNLVDNLFLASASPDANNTSLLKHSLANLHSNLDATSASSLKGKFNLSQINDLFQAGSLNIMYALNSKKHSMLLGLKIENDITHYYFFDPNFGLFTFNDKNKLFIALNEFMLTKKMAQYYSAEGTSSVPLFDLLEIDTEKMANVHVGNSLYVADLINSSDLTTISQSRKEIAPILESQQHIMSDLQLRCSLEIIESQKWGDKLQSFMLSIERRYKLDNKWLPVFSNISKLDDGSYLIPFVYHNISEEPRWLEISDERLIDFFDYLYKKISTLNEYYTFNDNELQLIEAAEQAGVSGGLNSAIAIQALIQSAESQKSNSASKNGVSKNLATALKINTYVNYSMVAQGAINDTINAIELASKLWSQTEPTISNIPFNFALSISNKANEGIGYIFSATQLSLDIYELANATTEEQKAIFGTQLTFDTMSLATGMAGAYASMIGASATATAFSSVGVILNGLGIGFIALSKAFSKVADNAKSVGVYFNYLDKAYQDSGYDYQEDHQLLIPRFGAVVKKINLHIGSIEFDSQYIYRTSERSAGGGRHNYIFWAGDFPHVIHDRSQALNIRENIGHTEAIHDLIDSPNIILPITPKSYIDYSYNILPGSTTRNDLGFNIIRRLEETNKFDYDFYIFPFENTITKLIQEYVHTSIEIILPDDKKNIIIPKIPTEWHGKIHYDIKGKGNEYQISINHGASITLHNNIQDEYPAIWVINSNEVNMDDITIDSNRIIIDGFVINIDQSSNNDIFKLVSTIGEVKLVNLLEKTVGVIMEDGSHWLDRNNKIVKHLNDLNKNNKLYEKYIVINDYHHNNINVGRAYYDVEYNRIIFTDSVNEENKYAILSAIDDSNAYFHTPNKALFWRVDILTGKTNMRYDASNIIASHSRITRLWQEHGQVYINFIHYHNHSTIASTYRLFNDNIELLSITDNQLLIDKLISTPTKLSVQDLALLSSHNFLVHHLTPSEEKPEILSNTVKPIISNIISIKGHDQYGINQNFWLRLSDGVLIKPNLESPDNEINPITLLSQRQSQWPIPFDLTLVSNYLNKNGEEVFLFYSQQHKCLFIQNGLGQDKLDVNIATAKRINIPNIKDVTNWRGSVLVSTDEGYIYQIDTEGQSKMVVINGLWFNDRPNWQRELENIVPLNNPLTLFGLKNVDNYQLIPTWYMNNRVALLPTIPITHSLKFLGFTPDFENAFIFNQTTGELYNQKTVDITTLGSAFHGSDWLQTPNILPDYINIYPKLHFKNIKKEGNGLLMLTIDEQLLFHDISENENNKTFSSTLIINGKEAPDIINPALIENVEKLVISGGEEADTYKFDIDSWKGYKAIIIDNSAIDEENDRIILPIDTSNNTYINRKDDDLILTDMTNTTTLVIRHVWGKHASKYRHLHLNFKHSSNPITVTKLIEFYDLKKEVISLDQLFHPTQESNHQQLIGSMSSMEEDSDINLIDELPRHSTENFIRRAAPSFNRQ